MHDVGALREFAASWQPAALPAQRSLPKSQQVSLQAQILAQAIGQGAQTTKPESDRLTGG